MKKENEVKKQRRIEDVDEVGEEINQQNEMRESGGEEQRRHRRGAWCEEMTEKLGRDGEGKGVRDVRERGVRR